MSTSKETKQEGRVLLPNHVVPERYDLFLTPDLQAFTFEGICTILFHVESSKLNIQNEKEITLHAKELCIASAEYSVVQNEVADAAVPADEILINVKATTVKFCFHQAIPQTASKIKLTVHFTGFINNQMAGFYRSNYTDISGVTKIMASTQFESLDARRCFPCVDEPAAKAVFGVTLTVPSNLQVLSNMPVAHLQTIKIDKKTVTFLDTPIMSTYLLAFCVGEFDCVQTRTLHGVLVSVYTPPGKSQAGRFALDVAQRSLDLYDDFFGVHFPLPQLSMVAIPEFAMGAMENWGLVTYREVDLLIDPVTASSNQKQRVAVVVTHELAHQWFGNLVTMAWWDDIWLNEGFASFCENYATDKLFPEYAMWDQFTTGALSSAMRLDALKSSHPIQVPIKHAEEVEQVFDAISYLKGSSVVRMIRTVLGMNNFKKGLVNYMKKHAYGNTETIDLWNAWEEASGMPVNQLLASWTEQMGFPLVKVIQEDWQSDKVNLTIEQMWFLSDGSNPVTESTPKTWTIPIITCTTNGTQSDMMLMREKIASISIPVNEGGWIKLNAGQEVPMRVLHTSEMLKRMATGIQSKQMHEIDRAALLTDTYALVKAGHESPENLIKLLGHYKEEDNYIVWEGLADVLVGLNSVLTDHNDICQMFKSFAKHIVLNLVDKVGWESKPSDKHLTTLLRGIMVNLVSAFVYDNESVVKEIRTRFAAFQKDPNDIKSLPSDYRTQVFKILLLNGGIKEYNEVKAYFYSAENNAERKHVLNSIGSISDSSLKLAAMEWSISGEIKLQDFFYVMGSVGRSNKDGRDIAWNFYKQNFESIKAMIGKASSSLMDSVIVLCAGSYTASEKADEIDAFFASHPLPQSTRKIAQVTESIRTNSKFLTVLLGSELSKEEFWSSL